MRSPVFFFISLLVCAGEVRAAWRIESRPLEAAPWGREIKPLISEHAELAHFEGSGLRLHPGTNPLFAVELPAGPRRELELQLAWLTTSAEAPPKKTCPVTLEIGGVKLEREVPLRSINPLAESLASLESGYDYLAPAIRQPVPAGSLRASAEVKSTCGEGDLFLYDPKIWVEREGPARRFVIVVTDSLSADWFEDGRDFMPFTRRWFSGPNAAFSTRVWSAGSNTHDTTTIVSKMQFRLRAVPNGSPGDDPAVRPAFDDPNTGLLPAFLNAGYDVITFNSNFLLSSVFRPIGFRNFYNLNVNGTPNNERSPEVMVALTKDWFARHPDHDALAFLWFDSTHARGAAPATRPGFRYSHMPYQSAERHQDVIALMARSMSYVDMAIESLAQSPQVAAADVVFFTDHGINFDNLEYATPLWGDCPLSRVAGANWHLAPVELRIPLGVRLHHPIAAPTVDSGLLDWLRTAVQASDPSIDVSAWEGRALSSLTAESPILSAGHGARASMMIGGRQVLLAAECHPETGAMFHGPGDSPDSLASDKDVRTFLAELGRRSLLPYGEETIRLLDGSRPCAIEGRMDGALDARGVPLGRLPLDSGRWFSTLEAYVPTLRGAPPIDLHLDAMPAGCAQVEVGNIRRSVGADFSLAQSDLAVMRKLPTARLVPGDTTLLHLEFSDGPFTLQQGQMVRAQSERGPEENKLSSELRAAMKRWGYIQDDAAE